MPRGSNIRYLYTSLVEISRLGAGNGPMLIDGAPNFNYVTAPEMADRFLSRTGIMKCRIDISFVKPGMQAPDPVETGAPIPRWGTLFYDVPPNPRALRGGDTITVIGGTATNLIGSMFQVTAIPAAAQDVLGPTHMEVQIVERAIDNDTWPGVEPGDVNR